MLPSGRKAFSSLIYAYGQTCCSHMYLFSATIAPYDFSKFTMFDAIENDYLCRLNVGVLINDNYNNSNDAPLPSRIKHLFTHISRSSYKSIIIYTTTVSKAKAISKYFNDPKDGAEDKTGSSAPSASIKKPIPSAVVCAKDSAVYRDNCFSDFRARKLKVLVTVNCISEGVDLPEADTAVFFDDRKSIINIIQCVGRVMRKHPSKLSSNFLIPVYKNDDIERLYTNILAVLNGDLGYGVADLRRILSVKYDSLTGTTLDLDIINRVGEKLIRYNQEYFSEISLNQKLNRCSAAWRLMPTEIPGYTVEWPVLTHLFPDFPDIKQFILKEIYSDSRAGQSLRSLYGLIKVPHEDKTGYSSLMRIKGVRIDTPNERITELITAAQRHELPKSLILDPNVIISSDDRFIPKA